MAVKIKGARRMQKTLSKLPRTVQRRTMSRGIAGSASEASKRLKRAAPTTHDLLPYGKFGVFQIPDKLLRKSIGRRRKTYQKTGTVFEVVGPRNDPKFFVVIRGRSSERGDSFRFVPMTRVAAIIEKNSPWARPAIDAMRQPLLRKMQEDIRKEIKAAAREAKR